MFSLQFLSCHCHNLCFFFTILQKYNNCGGNNSKDENDKDNNNMNVVSSVKSITDRCDLFIKQTLFAKYLLVSLGINVIAEVTNIPHEAEEAIGGFGGFKRMFEGDELYVDFNHFVGLCTKTNNGSNGMHSIYESILRLISTKTSINDNLLILCWQYVQSSSGIGSNDSNSAIDKFITPLLTPIRSYTRLTCQIFTYLFFKQFLLNSNIWFVKDYNSNKLLFSYINQLANELLIEQKNYTWQSVKDLKNEKDWQRLCKFDYDNGGDVELRHHAHLFVCFFLFHCFFFLFILFWVLSYFSVMCFFISLNFLVCVFCVPTSNSSRKRLID